MDKLLLGLFVSILIFVCLLFSIFNLSIKDSKFTCNRYILNTYLYIILTINIISILMILMEYLKVQFRPNGLLFFSMFFVSLACIFMMHYIDAHSIVLKHIVWLVFILLLGLLFYPMYNRYKNQKHLILSSMLTTLIIFVGLSFVAYIKPEWISLSWGPVLLLLLIGGIIMELITIFLFSKSNNRSLVLSLLSYFFIMVFMVFILYDTKRLQINALECVKADYIKESLGLFLDIFNIFVRLLGLGTR
jgi:FtsH-binding integral membrane protein